MRHLGIGALAALLVLSLAACSSPHLAAAGGGSPYASAPVATAPVATPPQATPPRATPPRATAPAIPMPSGGRVSNDPRITNHLGRSLPPGGGGTWVRPMANAAPKAIFYLYAFPG